MKLKLNVVAGMNLHSINKESLIQELNNDINCKKQQYISVTNTEAMYFGSIDEIHFKYINNARFSLCDGVGIKLAAKFRGINISRYHGPDMFLDIIKEGQKYGWSHYFLGGKNGVGVHLKEILLSRYPDANFVGVYSPPFRDLSLDEESHMIDDINKLKPNFLWVSLGLPKQEKWITKYKNQLDVNFCIGVGAVFDFHTGNVKRAPLFFQKIGLEWFYRTLFERRLVVRQIRGFKFLLKAVISNKNRF